MAEDAVIPENVVIETIFGCNASCSMCPIDMPTRRKKGVMARELFEYIISELSCHREKIKQMDLFGVGEPLLVKDFPEQVRFTKQKGFTNVGFASNADLLTAEVSDRVFAAGLDTIMISIDGTTKEVHESIRRKVNFDRLVGNVIKAIEIRDKQGYQTKFVMRFIRQSINRHQWEGFKEFWSRIISPEKGDVIIGYDVHTWGGEIAIDEEPQHAPVPEEVPCHHLFDRLIVLSDGSIPMCCSDMHQAKHVIGNCNDQSPIEIYNNPSMEKIREIHLSGKRLSMKICADCTILESEQAKEIR